MGNGGKVREQQRARELRAEAWTLLDIARELGVSKSSVSLWVRDVEFVPKPRNRGHGSMRPHPLQVAKLAEIERCQREGLKRVGVLSEREFLVLGAALYAGEGTKRGSSLCFANSDPRLIWTFVTWLRRFFEVDESKFRIKLYLHEGLDLEAAIAFWSNLTGIGAELFGSRIAPLPIQPSASRSTSWGAQASSTTPVPHSAVSWASWRRYLREEPFRGSSAGSSE